MYPVALAALACASLPVAAKNQDPVYEAKTAVTLSATVNEVRLVPAGNPLAGLHLIVKAKGDPIDVYVGPADFVRKLGLDFAKGNTVRVVGSQARVENADIFLAREIGIVKVTPTGQLLEGTTVYLRDDTGLPVW